MLMLAQHGAEQLTQMPQLLFVIGGAIAVVCIVAGAITKIVCTAVEERTKREMGAYVAEGSIEPDKAIAMLNAGTKRA